MAWEKGKQRGFKTGGRAKGTQNKITVATKAETKSFFEKILDDEVEAKFWRYFMTGYLVDSVTNACIPYPLNPISFAAFKRAVEYKRGMPMQPTEITGANGDALNVRFETVGSNAEILAAKARTLGLGN